MSKQPCRFYNTRGGCHSGTRCRYLHEQTSSQGSSRPSFTRGGKSSAPSKPHAPAGICDWFWSTGSCNRGFQCRFRHESPEDRPSRGVEFTATNGPSSSQQGNDLSQLSNATTDALFSTAAKSRTPSEVHNILKRFLLDKYQFKSTLEMYGFAGLISEANSNNSSWVRSFPHPSFQLKC